MLIYGVIIGFAVLKLVDLIRHAMPWSLATVTKDAIVIILAVSLALLFMPAGKDTIIVGLGAAGFASLIHKCHNMLVLYTDSKKLENIGKTSLPRR